jgi:hypothetical protein
MIKTRLVLSLLAGLGVLMVACGDSSSDGGDACPTGQVECGAGNCIPEADESLAWVQANVFEVNGCALATCHAGTNPDTREDLDLTSAQASFESLVDVESSQSAGDILVAPSDSNSSYLMNKLLGVDMAPTTQLMPIGATTPLCDAKIDGVRAWIDAGANP